MSKHTPGPWVIDRCTSSRFIKSIGPCFAEEYAGSAWLEVTEEDAQLIAAAPQLLEALKKIASCRIRAKGDVVDIAITAIEVAEGKL